MSNWKKELNNILTSSPLQDEPMSRHTTLNVGGKAEVLAYPQSYRELGELLKLSARENVPVFVVGQGSNLLVRDGGIKGIVISLSHLCSHCEFSNSRVRAGSAVLLNSLVFESAKRGLMGLEFAAGIPGSLGGAIYMNAGAYGSSIGDFVSEVLVMDYAGNFHSLSASELVFSYRWSSFQQEDLIILEVILDLNEGDNLEVAHNVETILKERQKKHPHFPSAGSVFRNPPGKPAGYLIEQSGGKGISQGGAQVSLQHGNFIVNKGWATAGDVECLIETIKQKVKEKFGIELDLEIQVVGENGSEQGRK